MQRFFIPTSNINNKTAKILGSDARQIQKVLRAKLGDKLIVCDGTSKSYEAEIYDIKKDSVSLNIIKELKEDTEPKTKITLAQSLPKASKMDFIIQKSVELGVFDVIPVISERSVPKINGKAEKKQKRWQKIAKEAAEQSGRQIIPQIHSPISFDDLLKRENYDLKLIPWELEKENSLKSILVKEPRLSVSGSALVVIGPEGGFSQTEIEKAQEAGFQTVSLGKRILRAETAPLTVLSNIFYELEQ